MLISLLLGFVYGTWHYMSHTFWAGIFVWLACLLTALAFYGRARLDVPVLKKGSASADMSATLDPAPPTTV